LAGELTRSCISDAEYHEARYERFKEILDRTERVQGKNTTQRQLAIRQSWLHTGEKID